MRNINITPDNKKKLKQICKDLLTLHTELENKGIIQKHEYDQAYKGKWLQLIVGTLKMFRDYIKYKLKFQEPTPLSRWSDWKKDNKSKTPHNKDDEITQITTGILQQIQSLKSNYKRHDYQGHDYKEVLLGCFTRLNIPEDIIKNLGSYIHIETVSEKKSPVDIIDLNTQDVYSEKKSPVDIIDLNTQDVYVEDERYGWNRGLKHVYEGPSSSNISSSETCIVLKLGDNKKSLKEFVETVQKDLKNNSDGQKSTLHEIQTHPNRQRFSG